MTPRELPSTPDEGDLPDENAFDAHRSRLHARNPDVVWVEAVRGRCALTDIVTFQQYLLEGPSAEIWRRIDGFGSDDEVVRAVLASYPEHPATAYAECIAFIDTMTDTGLLVHQPGADRGEPGDVDRPARGGHIAQPAQKGTVI